MKFKYNGRIYNPVNTEKKLKKMGITIADIEIIREDIVEEPPSPSDVKLYYYYNPSNGCSIISIYDNVNECGYESITKEQLSEVTKCWKISK